MEYTEVDCVVHPVHEFTEIVIAYLAGMGYSMFEETGHGVKAYIESANFDREMLDRLPGMIAGDKLKLSFIVSVPEHKNWNEEWEKNYDPVHVGKQIRVRANYHAPDPSFNLELVIHPGMAFGTGHHATTTLMMEAMLGIDFRNKKVLDMGCGSGILGILAKKRGASRVTAIDIDSNAVENTAVNFQANKETAEEILEGNAALLKDKKFDIILANINRNIILEDLPLYASSLNNKGFLLTSGYYNADHKMISEKAVVAGLTLKGEKSSGDWCQCTYQKIKL